MGMAWVEPRTGVQVAPSGEVRVVKDWIPEVGSV